MYEATLINFGTNIYTGASIREALDAVDKAGFEASVRRDGVLIASFSPIGGWKSHL